MSRVRSMQYDDQDQVYWDGGQEVRKAKSAKERCKQRKTKSIRRGIDEYWDKQTFRQNTANSYDDLGEWDDLDDPFNETRY